MHHSGIPVGPLIFAFINFLIFVFVLFFLLRKPVKSFLMARREKYIETEKISRSEYEKAESAMEKMKDKINSLPQEGDAFITKIKEDSKITGNKMVDDAVNMTNIIMEDARMFIDAERMQSRKRLKESIVSRIIGAGRDNINRDMTDKIKDRYLDEYTEKQ